MVWDSHGCDVWCGAALKALGRIIPFCAEGDARITAAWDTDTDEERDAWFAIQQDSVVAQIRAKVSAKGKNSLDSDASLIPPEFHELAILRLLIAILSRMGPTGGTGGEAGADPLSLTSDQRTRLTQLEKDLDMVAKGELGVSAPANPEGASTVGTSGSGVALASSSPRRFTRCTTAGL